MGKDRISETEVRDLFADLGHLANAHVAQPVWILHHLALLREDMQLAIVVAAMTGVALKHGHFRAVFGRTKATADANLVWT